MDNKIARRGLNALLCAIFSVLGSILYESTLGIGLWHDAAIVLPFFWIVGFIFGSLIHSKRYWWSIILGLAIGSLIIGTVTVIFSGGAR